jgi:hypothetical protein
VMQKQRWLNHSGALWDAINWMIWFVLNNARAAWIVGSGMSSHFCRVAKGMVCRATVVSVVCIRIGLSYSCKHMQIAPLQLLYCMASLPNTLQLPLSPQWGLGPHLDSGRT